MPDQQVFSGRYEMVRHIARGGMAQVYLARDLRLDRLVALKVLFPELSVDQTFVRRFQQEARAAANLTHPNIVSVFDWGQGERTYFMVMEYVDGNTLSSMIRQAPLPAERAASISSDVAGALDFAHRHGVIHRDVKPGNVLIDSAGLVKVADFGIARAIGAAEGLTQTGSVMGTATYFSPEQAQGQRVDPRSDVYSLGVVLYEMVVGKAPFTGDNPVAIAYKHVREEPVPPSQARPGVPRPYEAIVLKAMAKNPDDRYQDAAELRADLARFSQGQAVLAQEYAPTVIGAAVGAADTTLVGRSPATALAGSGGGRADTIVGVPPGVGGPPLEPEGEPPRDRRPLIIGVAVALLIVLAVLLFFLGRQLGWFGAKQLTVPSDLSGKPVAAATSELSRDGFTNVTQQTRASTQFNSGDVITTTPPPGTKTSSGHQVVVIVSSGPPQVAVPNVADESQAAATTALQGAGFIVTTTNQSSSTVTSGYVITSNPAPGAKAAKGSTVQLVLSTGVAQVQIPSVVGDNPGTASAKLGAAGLNVTQATESSQTIPANEVTRTYPAAGTSVPVGSSVTVYVSTGKPQADVPTVIGDSQAAAQTALQGAGFVASFTNQAVTDPAQNGVAVAQNPPGGATAAQGSTVTVAIGTYSPPATTVPASTTTSTSTTVPGPGGGGG